MAATERLGSCSAVVERVADDRGRGVRGVDGHDPERRVVAYLGPQPGGAATMPGALMMMDSFSGQELHIQGTSNIDGNDYLVSGGGSGNPAMPGVSIASPHTIAELTNDIPSGDRSKVLGVGASPSLGVAATTIDIEATRLAIQNSANIVLTSGSYSNYNFGSSATGTPEMTAGT